MKWNDDLDELPRIPQRRLVKTVYTNPTKTFMTSVYTFIMGMLLMPVIAGSLPATFAFIVIFAAWLYTYRNE